MKSYLIATLFLIVLSGCQQTTTKEIETSAPDVDVALADNGYQINGTIDFLEDVPMMYLVNQNDVVVDSVVVSNNSFSFNGSVEEPSSYSLSAQNNLQKTYPIILENSSFAVLLNDDSSMILGGDLNRKISRYRNAQLGFDQRKSALLNPTTFTRDRKKILESIKSIAIEQSEYTQQFIVDNNSNLLSTEVLNDQDFSLATLKKVKEQIGDSNNQSLQDALTTLIADAQQLEDEKIALQKEAAKKKEVYRAPAPMFTGESLTGSDLGLQTVLNGKKVVLVDFWASWCKPCRMVTPQVKQIYSQYKDKGFEIITVSEDKSRMAWKNGIEEDQMMEWEHIYDNQMMIASSFGVRSIPHMVLIDEKGRIINNKISLTQLRVELKDILD